MNIAPFRYIHQTNTYGCGVFAVMNAINYGLSRNGFGLDHQLGYDDIEDLEDILGTDEDEGTDEGPMIDFLRNYFYVTVKRKFSKKYMDKWLARGSYAIILYPYAGKYELHYSNVFERKISKKGEEYYKGANVWFKKEDNSKWSVSRSFGKELIKQMYHEDSLVIYLRWREGEE